MFVFVSVFVVVGIGVFKLSFSSCLSFVPDNCDNFLPCLPQNGNGVGNDEKVGLLFAGTFAELLVA